MCCVGFGKSAVFLLSEGQYPPTHCTSAAQPAWQICSIFTRCWPTFTCPGGSPTSASLQILGRWMPWDHSYQGHRGNISSWAPASLAIKAKTPAIRTSCLGRLFKDAYGRGDRRCQNRGIGLESSRGRALGNHGHRGTDAVNTSHFGPEKRGNTSPTRSTKWV